MSMARRSATIAAALLAAVPATACTAPGNGSRGVFPNSTGLTSKNPTNTDEINDIGFEPFYNLTGTPVRLRSVSFTASPAALHVINVRAYNYKHTKNVPLGGSGDLAKECPHEYQPQPINSYVIPPHGAASWFVVIAFTISKPGRYFLKRVRIDYTAGGHQGWQYEEIDTTMIVSNPPKPGPTPLPRSAVCG